MILLLLIHLDAIEVFITEFKLKLGKNIVSWLYMYMDVNFAEKIVSNVGILLFSPVLLVSLPILCHFS